MSTSLKNIKVARIATTRFFIVAQLNNTLISLKKAGAITTTICSRDKTSKNKEETKIFSDQHLTINIQRTINPLKDIISLIHLFIVLMSERFQIIHSTTPKAGLISAVAGILSRTPIRIHTFTGQTWVHSKGLKRKLLKACDRIIVKLNTQCYADSYSQRDFLVKERIGKESDIKVLGKGSLSGVDLNRFNPDKFTEEFKSKIRSDLGIHNNSKVILFAGRINKDKGVKELVLAFESLIKKKIDAYLILMGPIEENIIVNGEDLVSYCKKETRIHILGYCERPERYMSISDLLCLPSYREGFGTIVVEAAAMGVPTVATRIYGLTDAVEDRKTGVLIEPGRIEILMKTLKELIEDDKLKEMGIKARRRAEKHFDSAIVQKYIVNEYISLISKNQNQLKTVS